MAETNKSQLMSEAEIIEAINADSLISVSLGAGQPQKNVKMSTLASVAAGLMGVDNSALMYRGTSGQYGTYKDIDNLPFNGFYRMSGPFPSGTTPPGINYGIIINMQGGGYGAQISIQNVNDSSTTQVFARVMINAAWSPWASLT